MYCAVVATLIIMTLPEEEQNTLFKENKEDPQILPLYLKALNKIRNTFIIMTRRERHK